MRKSKPSLKWIVIQQEQAQSISSKELQEEVCAPVRHQHALRSKNDDDQSSAKGTFYTYLNNRKDDKAARGIWKTKGIRKEEKLKEVSQRHGSSSNYPDHSVKLRRSQFNKNCMMKPEQVKNEKRAEILDIIQVQEQKHMNSRGTDYQKPEMYERRSGVIPKRGEASLGKKIAKEKAPIRKIFTIDQQKSQNVNRTINKDKEASLFIKEKQLKGQPVNLPENSKINTGSSKADNLSVPLPASIEPTERSKKLTKREKLLLQLQSEKFRTKRRQLQLPLEQKVMQQYGLEGLLKFIQIREQKGRKQDVAENEDPKRPKTRKEFTKDDKQILYQQLVSFGPRKSQLTNREAKQLWIYGDQRARLYFYKKYIRDKQPSEWSWLPKDIVVKQSQVREEFKRQEEERKQKYRNVNFL